MTTYLIEYENVQVSGFIGLHKLDPADIVVIFLGAKQTALPDAVVRKMTNEACKAKILWKVAHKSGVQYVDCQLGTYLGSLIGNPSVLETEYVIVSKDREFESLVDYWECRAQDISLSLRSTIAPNVLAQGSPATSQPHLAAVSESVNSGSKSVSSTPVKLTPDAVKATESKPKAVTTATRTKIKVGLKNVDVPGHVYGQIYQLLAQVTSHAQFNTKLLKLNLPEPNKVREALSPVIAKTFCS